MINQYDTVAQYESATPSTQNTTLSHVESTNETHLDGVNVVTSEPRVGDALFLDEQMRLRYVVGASIVKSMLPASWLHVGYVYMRQGRRVGIIDKTGYDEKYLDVCQYAITALTATAVTIRLRMSPDYAVDTAVEVTLSSTDISAQTAQEISAAVAAKATEVGDTKAWWAYLADAEGNKVASGGTQIIIQCDECVDYRFYACSMTGGTITHITWGDMPENSYYLKNDGGWTNYWGVMNRARTRAWATSNGRVPTVQEPLKVTGNPAPVKPSCFEDPADEGYPFTADIRAHYGTYDNYLHLGYGVKYPQKYGTFALPADTELSARYANKMAPTKSGGVKAKFPALYRCAHVSYGRALLDRGDWCLPGSLRGCHLMADETLALLAPTISRMGTTAINNSTYRWFAERSGVYSARFFSGGYGILNGANVSNRGRVQAVTLLNIE